MQGTGDPLLGADPSGLGPKSTAKMDDFAFRRLNVFTNKSEAWKEGQMHFLSAVRQVSPQFATAMTMAEVETQPIHLESLSAEWAKAKSLDRASIGL